MFIDTHAHLSFTEFADDLAGVIERARAAGVERVISIATDLDSARQTLAIAEQFPSVAAAVGLHPGQVPEVSLCDLNELRKLLVHPAVVALGEGHGLDYYRDAKDDAGLRRQQQDLFWAQLELAREYRLPVVIHNRAADDDLMAILRQHSTAVPADDWPWGVVHCFSGDDVMARACVEIGLLVSFTGILTFKNAEPLRRVAAGIALERVMLETDAPYLAPVPHRGQRNEPAYLPAIAAVLAEVKGVTVDEVARQTTDNAQRLFFAPACSDR